MTRTTPLPVPSEGGSYIREKDGSLRRTEFTRQPGDPGSESGAGPDPAPAAPPMAAATPEKTPARKTES